MIKFDSQTSIVAIAVLLYLAAFFAMSYLGIHHAVPFLWALPVVVWYLTRSVVQPVLFLIPMMGAIYLGNIVAVIPEGAVPLTLFQIFLFTGIIIYLFHMLLTNMDSFRPIGIELELLLILTFISFTIIYSPNREGALFNLTRIIFLIIMVYLIVNILKERSHFYAIFSVMILIAIMLGIMSIQNTLLDPQTAILNIRAGGTRIFGRGAITVRDPNIFATLFFLPLAVTSSVFLSRLNYYWKAPALLLTLILLAGLASTYSRSAWISAAFLLFMLVIYFRQYKMTLFTFLAVVLIILVIPDLRHMSVGLFNRLLDIFAGVTDDSSRIRMLLGIAAINMFFDSWMMGVGFRGFPEMFTNYFTTQESIGTVEAHNVIYKLLAELGIIGFGLFLFLIIVIFRKASQNIRSAHTESDKIVATSLISTLAAFMIFFQFYGGAPVSTTLWAIIGLIFAQGYVLETRPLPGQPGKRPA